MRPSANPKDAYQAWLWGELLLLGLLVGSLALFATYPSLRTTYDLPELRLVIDTVITLAAGAVAVLAVVRFAVEGRLLDVLLACGFSLTAAHTLVFAIGPALDGDPVGSREQWAGAAAALLAAAAIALAPLVRRRSAGRVGLARAALAGCAAALGVLWLAAAAFAPSLPELGPASQADPPLLLLALTLQAAFYGCAVVGFGVRFRSSGADLDRWLALGATFLLFAALYVVLTPLVASSYVSVADFLRSLAYAVLLVGVWRAIRSAEFGLAVAEERARVAREIHDGLAQYLFAVSTHVSMLENGSPPERVLPRLKAAATAAQQEARFAVLALSSASGNAPFDAALRRYVEVLTADGSLDVELEIDPDTELAPDEQIEVFRIVQEGLANARKHSGARRAEVRIASRDGRRVVTIRDDGAGFEREVTAAGQGLKNMDARAARIDGALSVRSRPGRGTSLEVVLRA